jgi:hypothetical protein
MHARASDLWFLKMFVCSLLGAFSTVGICYAVAWNFHFHNEAAPKAIKKTGLQLRLTLSETVHVGRADWQLDCVRRGAPIKNRNF